MSSPTRRPCTAMPASHSGQFVMGSVPPSLSLPLCQTHKNALHPSLREGRRALSTALVIPPSFVSASRRQPRRVRTYSSPLTGASGKDLLSHHAISARSSGFYSRQVIMQAFHHSPALWRSPATATRPFKVFVLFSCSLHASYQVKDK